MAAQTAYSPLDSPSADCGRDMKERGSRADVDECVAEKDSPRLPYDIIGVVVDTLLSDGALATLANLTVTSRTMHQETLPKLYEKLEHHREGYFARIVQFEKPKGWAHTRYLHVTDRTSLLLEQHERFIALYNGATPAAVDLRSTFPRLVYLRVDGSNEHLPPYPSGPRTSRSRLKISHNWPVRSAGFAGTAHTTRKHHGGSLESSSGQEQDHDLEQLSKIDSTLNLRVDAHVLNDDIAGTLEIVLDLITSATTNRDRYALFEEIMRRTIVDGREYGIHLTCFPSVFGTFIRSFKSRQPLFLGVKITFLGDNTTRTALRQYVNALAQCYTIGWDSRKYSTIDQYTHLANIEAFGRIPYTFQDRREQHPDMRGTLGAYLEWGPLGDHPDLLQEGEVSRNTWQGFHAVLLEGWTSRRAVEDEDMEDREFHSEEYRCS